MPQAYTNIIFSKIIDNLSIIINNEFNIPVHYDEHKGNQSFLLTPESDSLISHLTSGIHRDYEVNISYQLKTGGQYTKNNFKQFYKKR